MYASSPIAVYWRIAYTSCVGCKYCIQVPSAPSPLPRRNSAPKIVADENEFSECLIIADRPGRDAGDENDGRQHHSSQRWLAPLGAVIPRPQSRGGQERKQYRAVQRGDAPEQAEPEPRLQSVAFFHGKREPENHGQQQRRKTCLPYPARAPVHHVGKQRPGPGRADRNFLGKNSPRDQKNRNAGQRGKNAIDAKAARKPTLSNKCRRRETRRRSDKDKAEAPTQ